MREERIEKERKEFNEWKNTISCYGEPIKGSDTWNVVIDGPKDSPYMGGKFKLQIKFPTNYPSEPPEIDFLTPICHINIDGQHICLDSLSGNYNPQASVIDLLSQIFMMLTSPNENSAYSKYSQLYKEDYSGYLKKAREMTREHAIQ